MKFLLAMIVITVFVSTSDRSGYNNCMIQVKSDYASERGAEHTAAICKAFFIEYKMIK